MRCVPLRWSLTPLFFPRPLAGEGDKDSLREFQVIDALQICLCQWFLEPERLRVLRLRRCHVQDTG